MNAARELRWPEKNFDSAEAYNAGSGDRRLQDDIVDFLKSKHLGFAAGVENTILERNMFGQSVLFALQPHLKTLVGREKPSYTLLQKVYNNPSAHYHKPTPLTQGFLDKLSRSLYTVLAFPWLQRSRNWQQTLMIFNATWSIK